MDYDKHEYILAAVEELQKAGSWTGKTHVQKALALASFVERNLPFEFVLYKHGPYSFDLDQELDQMLSYDAVKLIPQGQYGPTLKASGGKYFPEKFGEADEEILETIRKSAKFAGSRKVVELESLATAAWIRCREGIHEDSEVLERLQELKPHLGSDVAHEGVKGSRRFVKEFHLA